MIPQLRKYLLCSACRPAVLTYLPSRHAALLSRVSMLVSDSAVKLSSFRSAVRQFRQNESGAKDMLDTIFHVLDRDVEATTGVVREIAGLFDGEGESDKRIAVLEALNGFRAEVRRSP